MVVVLVTAGSGALRFTVPLTLVITGMLALLVVSYTQVIAAHPEGGGAYAVAKLNLGRVPALLAAASLFVDYVLTVAVSLAAGAASLGSVFPALAHHLLAVGLIGLAVLTAVNMFGIAESAKLLMLPAAVFVVSILAVIVVGPFHAHPVARIGTNLGPIRADDGARNRADPEGLRLRVLGGHRGRGDRQRRARVPGAARAQRAANRGLARRDPRRDARRARAADPRPSHRPARRCDDPRPADGGSVRDRLAVLRLEPRGRAGAGAGGEHELRRAAGADEPAREGQPPAAPLLPARGTAGVPLRDRRRSRSRRCCC